MASPLKRKAIDHIEDFVPPKKKVLVQINKTNLYVYPDVTPKMGDNKRSLTFNINKTALVNAHSISFNQKLNHMGELLGCSNIIDIEQSVYKNAAFNFLKINTNLIALSYHNAQGGIINDAFDPAGNLKPVADGPINACRPDGIFFWKVGATINLTNLDPSITPIPTSFFLRLQVAPDFTAPEAIVGIECLVNKIEEDTSKTLWNALLAKILRQVCPNFLNDPYKTLNRVRQHTTIDGNPVTQTVHQYHDQIQLVISTLL
jgi:hypothetical protein